MLGHPPIESGKKYLETAPSLNWFRATVFIFWAMLCLYLCMVVERSGEGSEFIFPNLMHALLLIVAEGSLLFRHAGSSQTANKIYLNSLIAQVAIVGLLLFLCPSHHLSTLIVVFLALRFIFLPGPAFHYDSSKSEATPVHNENCINGKTENMHVVFMFFLFISIVYRLAYLYVYPDVVLANDSQSYLMTAVNWLDKNQLVFNLSRTPVYPLFLTIWSSFFKISDLPCVQHLMHMTALILFSFTLIKYLRQPFGVSSAIVVLVSGSFLPSQFVFPNTILTETVQTALLLVLISTFIFWSSTKKTSGIVALAVLTGTAVLLRPANIILGPVCIAAIVFSAEGNIKYRNVFKSLLIYSIVMAMILFSWMAYNKYEHGKFAITNIGGVNLMLVYGYLMVMDSDEHKEYKEAISEKHTEMLNNREKLSRFEKLMPEKDMVWGKSSYFAIWSKKFNITSVEAHQLAQDMAIEGMFDKPLHVLKDWIYRVCYFYTSMPRFSEDALILPNNDKPSMLYVDKNGLFYRENKIIVDDAPYNLGIRSKRLIENKLIMSPLYVVWAFTERLMPSILILSFVLLPMLIFSPFRSIGIMAAGMVHGNAVFSMFLIWPEGRFFTPFTVVTIFLFLLELYGAPYFLKKYWVTKKTTRLRDAIPPKTESEL